MTPIKQRLLCLSLQCLLLAGLIQSCAATGAIDNTDGDSLSLRLLRRLTGIGSASRGESGAMIPRDPVIIERESAAAPAAAAPAHAQRQATGGRRGGPTSYGAPLDWSETRNNDNNNSHGGRESNNDDNSTRLSAALMPNAEIADYGVDFEAPTTTPQAQMIQDSLLHRTLTTRCELVLAFFEGFGQHPTEQEVSALVFETNRYFTDALVNDGTTHAVFVGFAATHVHPIYKDAEPDSFRVHFNFKVQVVELEEDATAEVLQQQPVVTLETLHSVIADASFPTFITDYIWLSPPLGNNQFAETKGASMKCYDDEVVV